ncbi:MAG: ankyrin repeat domain-containing protein [Candidatus Babeliales bacterium]|nr:ankyrin repeat domain-containing protein [Candidatus Babeliales bacterium]
MKNYKKLFILFVSLIFIRMQLPLSASRPAPIKKPGQPRLADKYYNPWLLGDGSLLNEYAQYIEQGREIFLQGYATPNKNRDRQLANNIANTLKKLLAIKKQSTLFITYNADPQDPRQTIVNGILTTVDNSLTQTKDILTQFIPKILALDEPPFPLLESLIAAGADINSQPYLMQAVQHATPRGAILTTFLIAHGANPNLVSNERTPLMTAAEQGNFKTVRELLEAGADPNKIIPSTGKSPLMELVKFAKIDDEDVDDALRGLDKRNLEKIEVLKLFLDKNVNLQAADNQQKTALDYATPAIRRILTENQQPAEIEPEDDQLPE